MNNFERKKGLISVPFPEEKFSKYFETYKDKSVADLNDSETETLFFKTREDYLKGILSLDEFSSICHKLWWERLMKDKKSFETKLGQVLYTASELHFYARQAYREELGRIFIENYRNVMEYEKVE